jgi:hypothetical protein
MFLLRMRLLLWLVVLRKMMFIGRWIVMLVMRMWNGGSGVHARFDMSVMWRSSFIVFPDVFLWACYGPVVFIMKGVGN